MSRTSIRKAYWDADGTLRVETANQNPGRDAAALIEVPEGSRLTGEYADLDILIKAHSDLIRDVWIRRDDAEDESVRQASQPPFQKANIELNRSLRPEEERAITQAAQALDDALRQSIFTVTVQSNDYAEDEVFGVHFRSDYNTLTQPNDNDSDTDTRRKP